jgi:diaminopimelate decarboxylase
MIDQSFARELAARFGTPLYVYDLDEVESRARTLRNLLPAGAELFYSFKANPLPAIAQTVRPLGCRAEVSSLGELRVANAAGFKPDHILLTGPAKSDDVIAAALETGEVIFSCESILDLKRLQAAAQKRNRQVRALLRINPAHAPQAQLAMTGVESQFGFDEALLPGLKNEIKSFTGTIEFIGVHVYFGTQVAPGALVAATRAALDAAGRVSRELGLVCRVVDAGGGFPWPYASAEAGPDLSGLKDELAALAQDPFARSATLWFESGRYLCASSGTLLATVRDVKESKGGRKYVVLDTGIHHLGGMSGLGRIPRPLVSVVPLSGDPAGELGNADLVGPLCSPLDSLARNLKLPPLKPGDLIAIPNVGAYGLSASLIGFLSHPPPKEIAYRGQQCVEAYQLRWGHEKI